MESRLAARSRKGSRLRVCNRAAAVGYSAKAADAARLHRDGAPMTLPTRTQLVRTCALCGHSGAPQAFVLKPDDHEKRICRYQVKCARRQLERDAEQKTAAAE